MSRGKNWMEQEDFAWLFRFSML